jgi:hypothetical protein
MDMEDKMKNELQQKGIKHSPEVSGITPDTEAIGWEGAEGSEV